jgi:hypothetical protein
MSVKEARRTQVLSSKRGVQEAGPTAGLCAGDDSWLDPKVFVWTVFVDLTGGGSGS